MKSAFIASLLATAAMASQHMKCITQDEAEVWLPGFIFASNVTAARKVVTKDYIVYSNSILSLKGESVRLFSHSFLKSTHSHASPSSHLLE